MQTKRASLPLLFVLTFAAIFLYSYHYHSSLRFSHLQNPNLPPLIPHRNPNPKDFTFTIKVLTFDRVESLRRCLRSLSNADYGGDRVNLHIFLDHFREIDPVNGSVRLERKLEESHRILDFIDGFEWSHGEKLVHYRTGNAGLQAQWLEAWWPTSGDDFAFVVEDDLEVSPLYYKFLKSLILKYYYDQSNYSPSIYGASLQRPRFVAGKHGNKLQVDSDTRLFLYQMVGTWGQLLFPTPWKEFRLWYDAHKAKGIKPILQGMVTTGWYKKIGEKIWTPWFIKFIHSRGYYNIYTNFLNESALSTSHRDAGVNYGKTAGPDSRLLDEHSLDFNLWEMEPLRNLKWYDFCFREVLPGRFLRSYDELGSVLGFLQEQKTITLVSLYRSAEPIARNLLCHLQSLSSRNFIFVGDNLDFLHDLARRGYFVVDSNQFINSIRSFKLTGTEEQTEIDFMRQIWVKSYVMKKCLELGYDSWMINGNIIPSAGLFSELPGPSYSVAAAKGVELMFVRSSPTSKIWADDFIFKVAAAGKALMQSNSISAEHRHFAYSAAKTFEDTGAARVWIFDELMLGVKVGSDIVNQKSRDSRTKIVFWSKEAAMDSIQRDLEKLGMWLIDGDLSCVSVVCHQ